ncbi:hypothetical protein INT45_006515 [Circinella minor]|uniref:Histone chaperone domain-containing protein n=1 Tax=Circinella minor TaxID=1195481 RepID=A0A8H7S160_9FUNG|nr:hypothetical protein INT45_006515 [Circinella minor]
MINELLDKALGEVANEEEEEEEQVEKDILKSPESTNEKQKESDLDEEDDLIVKKKESSLPKTKKQKRTTLSKPSALDIKTPEKSESDHDNEDRVVTSLTKEKGKQKKMDHSKTSSASEEKIKRLKSYIYKCGVRKKWNTELAGLNLSKQINKLSSILHELGVEGRPTLEKCQKVKAERELKAEIDSLNTENILDDDEDGKIRNRRTTRQSQPTTTAKNKRKRRIITSDDDDEEEEDNSTSSKIAKTSDLDLSFLGDQGSDSD